MSLASPPPHEVDWFAFKTDRSEATFVTARTWFAARSLAMAELGCGPDEIVVRDWPFGGVVDTKAAATRVAISDELKAATEKPKRGKLDALFSPRSSL